MHGVIDGTEEGTLSSDNFIAHGRKKNTLKTK